MATVSTVGFIVGAVGVGAGAYLLLSSGNGEAPMTALSTTVIRGGGGLSVLRQF